MFIKLLCISHGRAHIAVWKRAKILLLLLLLFSLVGSKGGGEERDRGASYVGILGEK